MEEKQALPPANNEATEGYPATGNPGFAGNSFGYPSSYPPQQGYGEGYAAQPGYQPTQQDYKSNQPTVVEMTSDRRSRRKQFQDPLCLAIFTTICCFWPIGIFAIFRASEARTAQATGYFEPAQTLSRESRRLSLIGIGIGCIGIIITIIVTVLVVNKIAVNTANYYLSQLNHETK
ncbi:proline-rich transmembrane protein 1-like isoform X3 [Pomacea canaliculata]|uniref:proline-rich transmembrane protein 1-like isoform X3 n=1 Tax=Pomacea canaliculata TaxID=400727 RepID=UPI000D7340C5|nr:proline-rich transmembrane protein 1-like isoform X3 [Pomacea canaliculata]